MLKLTLAPIFASTVASMLASASIPILPSAPSSAAIPPATLSDGGMQNRSASIHHNWKRNITTGKNSVNRNIATMVKRGIAKKQNSGALDRLGELGFTEPSFLALIFKEPIGLARPTPRVGLACAASAL